MTAQFFTELFDFGRGIFHRPLIYNLTRNTGDTPITAYKNTVLIYNPRAGRFGRGGSALIERITAILAAQGHRVGVAPTTGPGTAGQIARDSIARGADLVIAAGGDGTINEVAEGMIHSHVPLAILPGGTANVLAMEMRVGKDMESVARRLDEFQPRRISLGHLTASGGKISRHFLLMAGVGLDAHIVYRVNAGLKARTGKLAYWVAGASVLGRRLPSFQVEMDGKTRSCAFALISKVRNYGGDFEIARNVRIFDNQFEAVLFEGNSSLGFVKYLAGMIFNRLSGMKGVTIVRADRVKLTCPESGEIYVQIDGEPAGCLPAEIRIVPDALTLLLPAGY